MRLSTVLALAAICVLPACRKESSTSAAEKTYPSGRTNTADHKSTTPPATTTPPVTTTPVNPTIPANDKDLKITQDIRKALVDDASLSMDAHNVKVDSLNGNVTLRGPVDTAAEKDTVESLAKSVAGVVRVDNQLEVKGG